ncbi:DNA helicase RecQ [Halobacillus amylolyticus]|uniref:DNA helicase RecQ n=1 Tax=Halobacillus amylolyticus TaxID=2932259 RepID=A0ABY4H8U4_9BACI|nr:DNA helicase RecQ [Halobacillus amylolyticus]UOR11129.1 DNA helicase RecQ [Halobacillus amylolyticus]
MIEQAKSFLQEYYGFTSFRPGQEEAIQHVLQNRNTLAVMPTGGGKSLCYQIPGLTLEGTAIIISPLISLMKDQVDALSSYGIAATYINSSLSFEEQRDRIHDMKRGRYQFVYVAPERFDSSSFLSTIKQIKLSLIAFDEAHCISQWGHDFRPSYRSIVQTLYQIPNLPVIMGLTATATQEVIRDIKKLIQVTDESVVNTGFARENLSFRMIKGRDKRDFILEYLEQRPNESGIIYTATRKDADHLQNFLSKKGFSAGKYHAGMTENQRKQVQSDFVQDEITTIIATNAFGMGIDKSNVRYVIHYSMPMNIESYYQEAGRAGRDGEPGDCVLLFSGQDIHLQRFLIDQSMMGEEKKKDEYQKLQSMINYCHTHMCLQQYILDYFADPTHTEPCGKCSNCLYEGEEKDMTKEAQMVLSCVKRMGERFGAGLTAKVLRGSSDQKVLQFKFHKLTTYGILSHYTEKGLTQFINFLTAEGLLSPGEGRYPTLKLTPESVTVLKGEKPVKMLVETTTSEQEIDYDVDKFEVLRVLRKELADTANLPPYVIFSDATLKDFTIYLPMNEREMLRMKGVGEQKFEQYGEAFLEKIKPWAEEAESRPKPPASYSQPSRVKKKDPADPRPSHEISFDMWKKDEKTIEEVAELREMSAQTIENHIFRSIREGEMIDWDVWFNDVQEENVLMEYSKLDEKKLRPLKEALPEDYSYRLVKAVLVKHGYMK